MHSESKAVISFSETEAHRILARAAELEPSVANRFTIEDLRNIAAKAGIDPMALERAMSETRIETKAPAQEFADAPSPQTLALLAGAGAVLGPMALVADRASFGDFSAIAVFGPSAVFAAYRALRHPLKKGMGTFLREIAVFFGTFTLTIAAMDGTDGISVAASWSLLCGALSAGLISLRQGAATPSVRADPVDSR